MIDKRRFKINLMANSSMSVLNGLLQLGLISIIARLTNELFFSHFILATALVAICEHGSDFGSRVWAMKSFATATRPIAVLRRALSVKAVFSGLLLLVLLVAPVPQLSWWSIALCFVVAVTQPTTDPLLWFVRARERLDHDALVLVAWKVGTTGSMALLAVSGHSLNQLLMVWLLVNLLRILIVAGVVGRNLSGFRNAADNVAGNVTAAKNEAGPTGESLAAVIKTSIPTGAAFLLMALNQRIMLFALGLIASSAELGRFAASHTIVSQAGFLATAVVLSYLPALAKVADRGDDWRFAELVRRKLATVTLLVASFCFFGILLSPVAKQLLYGRNFSGASELMILLWPGLFLWSASVAMRYLLTLRNKPWHDLAASLVGVVIAVMVLSGLHAMFKGLDLPLLAATAWLLGLLVECAMKTWALVRDGVLQLTTVSMLTGTFVGLVVIAVAYRAIISAWFPGVA